jgi:hypothetical protein
VSEEWAGYWVEYEMPFEMPAESGPAFCPSCAANSEEVVVLGNLTAVVVDLGVACHPEDPSFYASTLARLGERWQELLDIQRGELEDEE